MSAYGRELKRKEGECGISPSAVDTGPHRDRACSQIENGLFKMHVTMAFAD